MVEQKRLNDQLWDAYDEEFWLWLDAEIERIETVLENLKKIREKRDANVTKHRNAKRPTDKNRNP